MRLPRPSSVLPLAVLLIVGACGPATPPAATGGLSTGATGVSTTLPPSQPAGVTPTEAASAAIAGAKVSFHNGDLRLDGLLWKPVGNGPFPAVIWNHGSEPIPGNLESNPKAAAALAAEGYVVFIPLRRGQGSSEGTYIIDALNAVPAADRPALLAKLHTTEQLSDQLAGLAHLRTLAYVDGSKVAVAGWSFGGIQTVLGAGNTVAGYVAAVAFTPASQSWDGNPDLQAAMLAAAKAATAPFLLIQAENDYSLVPTEALRDAIGEDGGMVTRSIYPAFGSTAQDGHEFAVRGTDQWMPEVAKFLNTAFGR